MKIRIAVVVSENGDWNSCGWRSGDRDELMGIAEDGLENVTVQRYWLEADLPEPSIQTVIAKISEPRS